MHIFEFLYSTSFWISWCFCLTVIQEYRIIRLEDKVKEIENKL